MQEHLNKPEQAQPINLTALIDRPNYVRKHASLIQFEVASETIGSRGPHGIIRYGPFFATFWFYGLFSQEKSRVLRSSYFWLRYIDDIADGDTKLPPGYDSGQEFMEKKIGVVAKFSSNSQVWGDKKDILFVDYTLAARRLGIDLTTETVCILNAITLDEERRRTKRKLWQDELDVYFKDLDDSTINGALKLAGDAWAIPHVSKFNEVVRIRFNLNDMPKDLATGIVNISIEDLEQYGIDLDQCKGGSVAELLRYEPLRNWCRNQHKLALNSFQHSREELRRLHLKFPTRLALTGAFINPTQQSLNKYQRVLDSFS